MLCYTFLFSLLKNSLVLILKINNKIIWVMHKSKVGTKVAEAITKKKKKQSLLFISFLLNHSSKKATNN